MSGYSALAAAWTAPVTPPTGVTGASLAGLTTAQKIIVVNSWSVQGPPSDVPTALVLSYLAMNGKLANLQSYAASATIPFTIPQAAARELNSILMAPNMEYFQMSLPNIYAGCQSFLNALTTDPNTGITSADVIALMNLSSTTQPWWLSIGLTSPINQYDLIGAGGLI